MIQHDKELEENLLTKLACKILLRKYKNSLDLEDIIYLVNVIEGRIELDNQNKLKIGDLIHKGTKISCRIGYVLCEANEEEKEERNKINEIVYS